MGVCKWCLLGAYLSIKDSELGQSFIQSNLFIVKSLIRENDYLLFIFAPTTAQHSQLLLCNNVPTHPPGLGLILECLLGVLGGGLHVIHGVLHVVLDTVYHLPLQHQSDYRTK